MEEYIKAVDAALAAYLTPFSSTAGASIASSSGTSSSGTSSSNASSGRVLEAMGYSVSAGGKRLRACLVLEFSKLCGGEPEKALPFACGVEMVHTYSLIHDDLPCMDDDDLRRGKPSCHKQFDEATALLAGDGLLTAAFGVLASAELPPNRIAAAVAELSAKAGAAGMVGGQEMDMANEQAGPLGVPLERLKAAYGGKTCALIEAAAKLGVIAAGGSEAQLLAAERYGRALGMAFQITDDILDVVGDEESFGKPIGSDAQKGKPTYASLLGVDGAKAEAAAYTEEALAALADFDGSERLAQLTKRLLVRDF